MSRHQQRIARGRGTVSIDDIAAYVKRGYPQSTRNCRVLLDEINRLRQENSQLRRDATASNKLIAIQALLDSTD